MGQRKTVLVTGAAAGIGAGIVRRFAEAGWAVALLDQDAAGVERMARELSGQADTLAIAGDIAVESTAEIAIAQTVERFGHLNALINNAGIEVSGAVDVLETAEWDRQIAVNLRGAFLMSKYAVRAMISHGGSIVNISSVHAFLSWPGAAAYDATKAGLIGLTRAMALDHGQQGIRVNAICPGYIDTPLLEGWFRSLPDPELAREQVRKLHPGGRIGTPRDIANAAFFLVSEEASFISGAALVVDGAMSIAGH